MIGISHVWCIVSTFRLHISDLWNTILSCFLAHVPISKHASLLEYSCMEVNCNVYTIDGPTFLIISQNAFFGYRPMPHNVRYTV